MNDISQGAMTETQCVVRWLAAFEAALTAGDAEALRRILGAQVHWRDLMALTWTITPHDDVDSAVAGLLAAQAKMQAHSFRLAETRTAPRRVTRHGTASIEAFFSFETTFARCSGTLRLLADAPDRAWVLATSLDELKGHEEPINMRRPAGSAYSRNFGGDNWTDIRAKKAAFTDRDPAVLIIGAGQAGLAIAARLGLLGVDTLIVDKTPRVGDVWRNRYHSLALHNQVKLNHMPYLPWPPNWPKYLPKDMIAGWLETYAWAMECNVWTSTEFLGATYDEGRWTVTLRREDGTTRVMKPRHLVMANGIAGKPLKARLPGLDSFKGTVLHTNDYGEGAKWRGRNVIVVGAGTSGHDVAQDLHGHGAKVTMIQRGATTVASIKAAGLVHSVYYEEDIPLEDCDGIAIASSYPLLVKGYQSAVVKMKEIDRDLLDGLTKAGFKLDFGADETGHQMKFRRRHGGYYLDCGCSELIAKGEIAVVQAEDTDHYTADGLRMKDGSTLQADLVVTATGYQSQETVVREMLGDAIADRVGQIWGIAPNGEIANMFVATPQPGLWFSGGGFAHCRIYSHYIAMGIKLREMGLI
ncbi:NAD(P)/FAD-dependent oxidoreductase [Rhodobacter sp. KR11]|uniref:flavin-containing monooxygenase n=1 Tax=Rhodobacter sp. KR11 TaxID=2974588 RepID=UPI002223CED9|nr:NAD(P)/FAD-dependent oxidoreductase [Rhodobacter sp. KR11]MCW1918099.1 NAD(P)/FAD-dependent oxidoreductase [Rhodobacter sp. KR11]